MKIKSLVLNFFVALLILTYAIFNRQQSSPRHMEIANEKSEIGGQVPEDTTGDTSNCTVIATGTENNK